MADSINFFLQWEEYFAAQEFFRRRRQSFAPEWVWGGLLILVGVILLVIGASGILAAGVVVFGLAILFGAPIARRWTSKRKWQREPLYHTEHEVSFGEDGVHFRMGQVESNLDWKYYQRLLESQDGLLLVYGDESFNLLPKRAFANETLINTFRALAQKKLK
jgi:hypothetical protein